MRKRLLSFMLLVCVMASNSAIVANAAELDETVEYTVSSEESAYLDSTSALPEYKQEELDELQRELNLSQDDVKFLEEQYVNYHSNSSLEESKLKAKIVLKVLKAAKPVIKKACKMFGLKMGEKSFADFTDYLFEWEGDLQTGIENSLMKVGMPKTAAHWTAKTIMFVVF